MVRKFRKIKITFHQKLFFAIISDKNFDRSISFFPSLRQKLRNNAITFYVALYDFYSIIPPG